MIALAGCSTHPCADISDYFKPGHLYPDKVAPYGGSCAAQSGTVQGTSPGGMYVPVVPPPEPLPVPPPPTGPITVPTFPAPSLPPLR